MNEGLHGESRRDKVLRESVRQFLEEIPEACADARIYAETLNFCECHLVSQAIRKHYCEAESFEIDTSLGSSVVSPATIDAKFIHELISTIDGSSVSLSSLDQSFVLKTFGDELFAVLAGEKELLHTAIPFPDDVWECYLDQNMQKYDQDYVIVKSEYLKWVSRRDGRTSL